MPTHAESIIAGVDDWYGPRWVHSAAILVDGKVYAGDRYWFISSKLRIQEIDTKDAKEGFLLNTGEFVNPVDALALVVGNEQGLMISRASTKLHPEDLWSMTPLNQPQLGFHDHHHGMWD